MQIGNWGFGGLCWVVGGKYLSLWLLLSLLYAALARDLLTSLSAFGRYLVIGAGSKEGMRLSNPLKLEVELQFIWQNQLKAVTALSAHVIG